MSNFKSISFKMAVLQGGGQNLPSPCVCYPKDTMQNRVKNGMITSITLTITDQAGSIITDGPGTTVVLHIQ